MPDAIRVIDTFQELNGGIGGLVDGAFIVWNEGQDAPEGVIVSIPDDATLVHNVGDEEIGGAKTFTDSTVFQNMALGGGIPDLDIFLNIDATVAGSNAVKGVSSKVVNTNNTDTTGVQGKGFNTGTGGGFVTIVGVDAEANYNGTGAAYIICGNQSQGSNTGSGTAVTVQGQNSFAINLSSGGATNAYGSWNEVATVSGTIVNAVGVLSRVRRLTGAITTAKGLSLEQWAGSSFTTSYGIYADATIDRGAIRYFIYSLSTSPSVFSGTIDAVSYTGQWLGTAIADAQIASAATWNAKQDALNYTLDTDVTLAANSDVKVPSQKAAKAYVDAAIAALLNSAPGALDTLDELAAALGDDPNFATTVTNSIATKLAKASNLSDLTDASAARTNLGLAIGTNVQAFSSNLSTYAGIAPSANVQTLLGAANFAAFRSSLSLVVGTDVQAFSARLSEVASIGSALQQIRVNAGGTALEYFTPTTGANAALSNLASVAINTALLTGAGVAASLTATAPAAANGASQAGIAASLTASAAVASLNTNGAAAGGSVTITAGAAARLTSGNANGGNINLVLGTGIGSGTGGQVVLTNAQTEAIVLPASTGLSGTTSIVFWLNGQEATRFSNGVGLTVRAAINFCTSYPTVTSGLRQNAGGIVEVNNGTSGQWGSLLVGGRDAGTTTVVNGLTVGHQSTGTPAAGLGSGILFNINSSTTADQNAAQLAAVWTTATHASRSAELQINVVENAGALATVAKFDKPATAGNTGLWIWDADNGQLERVTVGAADSGGAGFKLLRIAN